MMMPSATSMYVGLMRNSATTTAICSANGIACDGMFVADAGFIAENVYLFCASEGLATVIRASVPKETLAKALKLSDTQLIVLAQTVGYSKK